MANIIDGKLIASEIKEVLKTEIEKLKGKGIAPGLAVIIVGQDQASQIYVKNKEKMCKELGIDSKIYRLNEETDTAELIKLIDSLNEDKLVHGILLQHPVPSHIDEILAFNRIKDYKDIDGFGEINIGKLSMGQPGFISCTPLGILEMLKHEKIGIEGRHCVIIGRSNIVGKPMAQLMLKQNATVTICHSKTKNLEEICRLADILIVAMGKEEFIKADMIKEGAVVIDVGINRVNGKIVGDVDFDDVSKKASFITPVPGGVGPMTMVMLMRNVISASQGTGSI